MIGFTRSGDTGVLGSGLLGGVPTGVDSGVPFGPSPNSEWVKLTGEPGGMGEEVRLSLLMFYVL